MIFMITIVLSILVAINFLLLKFSCNKTAKRKNLERPFIVRKSTKPITSQSVSGRLAATGS